MEATDIKEKKNYIGIPLTDTKEYRVPYPPIMRKPFDCAFMKEVKKLLELSENGTKQQ